MWKGLARQVLGTVGALAVMYLAWNWAVHYAYICRGYYAVGGEYMFILIVYGAVYKMSGLLFDILDRKRITAKAGDAKCDKYEESQGNVIYLYEVTKQKKGKQEKDKKC